MNIINSNQFHFHKKLLKDNLHKIFGEFDESILTKIEDKLEWIELEGGDELIKEGDEGDSLFFVLSGRLEASSLDHAGKKIKLGEIIKGEIVGEMSVYTGSPRSATVTALRNSVLVQLTKNLFDKILNEYPAVSKNVTKLVIERLRKTQSQSPVKNLVNICMVNIHAHLDKEEMREEIYQLLEDKGNYLIIDEYLVEEKYSKFENQTESIEYSKELINWLNNLESRHDKLFYLCDSVNEFWRNKCIKQADHLIIFADASKNPNPSETEIEDFSKLSSKLSFVLVHPESTDSPRNSRSWIDPRPWIHQFIQIRRNNKSDYYRLSRIINEKAIGIVFAGGGAKGFAHLGVLKALEEEGMVFDFVGGTSIGSHIATGTAYDLPTTKITEVIRKGAFYHPSKDINIFPILSIVKGYRLKTLIETAVSELSNYASPDISDTWKNIFVIATNFSIAEEGILTRGDLSTALLASSSIPGVFPTVIINNHLFVDGGTFNNFPVDVMKKIGVEKIIGIDFELEKPKELKFNKMPSNSEILIDKLKFWRKPKHRIPTMASVIINSTILYSTSKRGYNKKFLDLHFNPDVRKFGITDWNKFDEIVEDGYNYAKEILSTMSEEQKNKYRN